MSHFGYCPECSVAISAPTAREDLIEGQFCANGHRQPQRYSVEEWVAMLYDNIIEMQKEAER